MCLYQIIGFSGLGRQAVLQYEQTAEWCPPGCDVWHLDACYSGVLFFYCPEGDPNCPGHVSACECGANVRVGACVLVCACVRVLVRVCEPVNRGCVPVCL